MDVTIVEVLELGCMATIVVFRMSVEVFEISYFKRRCKNVGDGDIVEHERRNVSCGSIISGECLAGTIRQYRYVYGFIYNNFNVEMLCLIVVVNYCGVTVVARGRRLVTYEILGDAGDGNHHFKVVIIVVNEGVIFV